jgi:hypothetical protein
MQRALVLFSLLLTLACPGGDNLTDAGAGEDGGSLAPTDAGEVVPDAGEAVDAGPDAGSPSDGGQGEADAGPGDAGTCAPTPSPCATAPSVAVHFEVGAGDPAFGLGAGATLVVGQATRAEVEALLGAPAPGDNAFRARHCEHGLRVEYVDDKDGNDFEGEGSSGDLVARVVALEDALLTSSNGVIPGITRAAAQAALSATVSHDLPGGGLDADLTGGMLAGSDESGAVASVALFRPQQGDAFALAVNVASARLGPAGRGVAQGSSVTGAEALLGTAFDAEGRVRVRVNALVTLNYWVRIYAAFGVRLVALCTSSPCGPNANVQQIIVSPPFAGADQQLSIGATRADFEARFGAGSPSAQADNLTRYAGSATGGRELGVAYLQGADCTERAAALVLNYTEAP